MLIAVLAMGGAMLAATTIAGLLILYQLRATTNSVHSSQAIFAADSGIEWELFNYYCGANAKKLKKPCPPNWPIVFSSVGASTSVTCYGSSNNQFPDCSNTASTSFAVSKGTSLDTSRAFYLEIMAATTTFP